MSTLNRNLNMLFKLESQRLDLYQANQCATRREKIVACEKKKWFARDCTVLRPDVEVKHWEERNSDIALHESNQEYESQRLQQQQANQWADQAHRDKTSFYEELEMRNRLFRENQATYCCEEADRARQARIDELSMHQERKGILRL